MQKQEQQVVAGWYSPGVGALPISVGGGSAVQCMLQGRSGGRGLQGGCFLHLSLGDMFHMFARFPCYQ